MTYRIAFPLLALLVAGGCSAKDTTAPMTQTKSPGASVAVRGAAGSLSADRGLNGQEADSKGKKRHTFNDTFTKWITTFPNMAGIVGGDVGAGTFAGEILNIGSVGTITNIEALYHFNGEDHSFTAHVYITEDDAAGNAVITGRVTEGWLEGAGVTGEYTIWAACPIPTPGNSLGTLCFQGALHIVKGGGD